MKTPEINTAADMALSAKLSRTLEKIDTVQDNITEHKQDQTNPHLVTKEQVGLGNADNTADADKPVSVAQQATIIEALKGCQSKLYHPCSLNVSTSKFLDLNTCIEPGIYYPHITEEDGEPDFETFTASLQTWPQEIKENFGAHIVYGGLHVGTTSFAVVDIGTNDKVVFQTIFVAGKAKYRRFFCISDGSVLDVPDPDWLNICSTKSYIASVETPITPGTIPQTYGKYIIKASSGANPYISGFPAIPDTSGDIVEIFEEEEWLWKYTHRENSIPKKVWYSKDRGTTWVEGAF